jgi:hypothetical protein
MRHTIAIAAIVLASFSSSVAAEIVDKESALQEEAAAKKAEKIKPVNTVDPVTRAKVNAEIEAAEVTADVDGKKKTVHIGFSDNASRANFKKADAATKAIWIKAAVGGKVIVDGKLADPK